MARTPSAIAYKAHVLDELALRPGLIVADLGCGPGTDLPDVARLVDSGGLVTGVDVDTEMLTAAASRVGPEVALMVADTHRLPFRSASLDRIRTDRALQHMRDPRRVLAEAHRVLRPGGLAVIAEPDWGTLLVDARRGDVSAGFVEYTCREVVRNAVVGREISRLGRAAGFDTLDVVAFPTVVRDFAAADKIFGLTRNAHAAVRDGYLRSADVDAWLADLVAGPVLVSVTLFATTLSKPAG